jgi:SNF2 family DNA or RNA helicase
MRLIKDHIILESKTGVEMPIPGLKRTQINDTYYTAVPYNDDSCRILKNLGYQIEEPIRRKYQWSGSVAPYKHQIETAAFFTMNHRAFCLSGMGSGKTLSALWAADWLMSQGLVRRCLILSPLSTLERVWGDEIFRHFYKRSFAVLHGSRDKRLKLLECKKDFYIINHDGIETVHEELKKRDDIDLIIIDEAATYRNHQTKRWGKLKTLLTPAKRVWALTGTPTPNAPTDAYGIAKLVKPENYNGSFTRFKNDTMMQLGQFKWVARNGAEQMVNSVLSPAIRFATRDCIDLPPTIYHERQTELTGQQKHALKQLEREAVTEIGDKTITAVNAAVLISKIVQASCGLVYASDGSVAELDFGPRLDVLKECIEEAQGKVIVFVPFTGMLDALVKKLQTRWTCETIDGGVTANKRNDIFQRFQNSADPHILVANPGTMSHGLNLTVADTIIWYAPIWSGETYPQANARVERPGQTKTTNIVHIFATSTERRVFQALKEKGKLQDAVLELVKKSA